MVCVGAGSGGIWAAVAVAPSGTSTCSVMTSPVTSVTRTLCNCAEAVAHEHGRVERGSYRGGEKRATDHPAR